MKYPDKDSPPSIPEPTGQVTIINPDDPTHRAIVGESVADKVKEIQSRRQLSPAEVAAFYAADAKRAAMEQDI